MNFWNTALYILIYIQIFTQSDDTLFSAQFSFKYCASSKHQHCHIISSNYCTLSIKHCNKLCKLCQHLDNLEPSQSDIKCFHFRNKQQTLTLFILYSSILQSSFFTICCQHEWGMEGVAINANMIFYPLAYDISKPYL